ncbi:MAG TPA: GFA family protein [Burkholderiales bacterium]|nr:GFA family protein [Burkholderiales bacterium]
MANLTGGCLCGAIQYELTQPVTELRACHCLDCQKASGAGGSVNAVLPSASFKITKGTPRRFDAKAASGRTLYRFFCGDCGSPIYSQRQTTPETVVVRAGTIDNAGDMKLTAHIWTARARPWSHIDPAATKHPGQPG